MEECGLVKYCIKISQIDKLENLIEDACENMDMIRIKEEEYRDKANTVLSEQIDNAKIEILKVLNPLKVIHYGSYWMKDNDVVNTMADDLAKGCKCKKVDLKVYSNRPDARIASNIQTPNGKLCQLKHSRIIRDSRWNKADAVILNSGGLYLEDRTFEVLSKRGTVSVGISLSDPDVYPYNGAKYADKFDFFYTNSKYSFLYDYNHENVNIRIMPFAASTDHHYYMPDVEKKYDLVVVAHSREDRISVIEKLEGICMVGCYGN